MEKAVAVIRARRPSFFFPPSFVYDRLSSFPSVRRFFDVKGGREGAER